MQAKEYNDKALRTEADQSLILYRLGALGPEAMRLDNAARGLAGDAGEVSSAVMKFIEYGKPFDKANMLEEVGDCLWRLNQVCAAVRGLTGDETFTLESAMDANIRKLAARYPDKYSDDKAINRNKEAELKAIEQPPFGVDYLGGERKVPHPNDGDWKTCRYCSKPVSHKLIWFRGAFGKPGPVAVAYCGSCDIREALRKRGMTAPVEEGKDYKIEPIVNMQPVVQDGHGFGHVPETDQQEGE